MNNKDILAVVADVIIDFFDDDEIEINEGTVAADVDGWDSLAHISLLAALEEKFNIQFSVEDSQHMKNVGDIVVIIKGLIEG